MKTLLKTVSRTFASILLSFLFLGNVVTAQTQQNVPGKVTGSVFDWQDAVIPGTEITVENQNVRKNVISNSDGKYTVELPPGIYTLTTGQGVLYSVRRAVFLVRANEATIINLSPEIRVALISLELTPKGIREPVEYNSEPKYEEFLPFPDSPLNIVVEYRGKKRKGSITEYRGAKLTYNNQSVFANVLRLDKRNWQVEAKGNVTVDENGQRERKQNVSLQITKVEREDNDKPNKSMDVRAKQRPL